MLKANPRQANQKFQFRRRVKFSMSKKKIQSYLEELDDCIKQLERFTDKSERLETYRKASKPSFAKKILQIQAYARQLHEVLVQSWTCSCRSAHAANLQLEQRLAGAALQPMRKYSGMKDDITQFNVSFSSTSSPWSWQEAHIKVIGHSTPDSTPGRTLSPASTLKLSKSVSFGSTAMSPVSRVTTSMSIQSSISSISSMTLMGSDEVDDICSVIHQHHSSAPCIEFCLDKDGKLCGGYPLDDSNTTTKANSLTKSSGVEMISLEDLLHPHALPGRGFRPLSKRQRYQLAVNLASSTLQLYSTPWFKDEWTKKDILFRRLDSGTHIVDIDQPYVTHACADVKSSEPRSTMSLLRSKNSILLALAVALLELYFGSPFEDLELQGRMQYLANPSPWALLAMVCEWADHEQENLSAAFASAIKCCLQSFSDPNYNLLDQSALQTALEGIVLPLQEELTQFLGKPAFLSNGALP
jgi:hypothetical protein